MSGYVPSSRRNRRTARESNNSKSNSNSNKAGRDEKSRRTESQEARSYGKYCHAGGRVAMYVVSVYTKRTRHVRSR